MVVVEIDHKGPDSPFQGIEAYFDGSHSQCIGYTTLALFVFHFAMHYICTTITIDVKCKSTQEIAFYANF